jgi:hypothetical protein
MKMRKAVAIIKGSWKKALKARSMIKCDKAPETTLKVFYETEQIVCTIDVRRDSWVRRRVGVRQI